MKYALIDGGAVVNVIVLSDRNAQEFPGAVKTGDVPAAIGDSYSGGLFFRGGEALLSPLDAAHLIIAALDAEIIDLTYQNIMLEMGM
ncbi:MAG: hypothetical protein JW811_10090 [Clostridiales bacterium]|nr:hypothetical protein [Clostridiales bacterium]